MNPSKRELPRHYFKCLEANVNFCLDSLENLKNLVDSSLNGDSISQEFKSYPPYVNIVLEVEEPNFSEFVSVDEDLLENTIDTLNFYNGIDVAILEMYRFLDKLQEHRSTNKPTIHQIQTIILSEYKNIKNKKK